MNGCKVIYIAGPFRARGQVVPGQYNYFAQVQHIRHAEAFAHQVWALGHAALYPHLNTANFQGSLPDAVWLEGDLALLRKCDAVLAIPGWRESSGATEEVRVARAEGIPVFTSVDELKRVCGAVIHGG